MFFQEIQHPPALHSSYSGIPSIYHPYHALQRMVIYKSAPQYCRYPREKSTRNIHQHSRYPSESLNMAGMIILTNANTSMIIPVASQTTTSFLVFSLSGFTAFFSIFLYLYAVAFSYVYVSCSSVIRSIIIFSNLVMSVNVTFKPFAFIVRKLLTFFSIIFCNSFLTGTGFPFLVCI